ncbi:dipeptidase [Ktedonobacteria bacterium brp13]|nr:dipeptidase [Ktedonobacteria bacterium brp13]
MRLNEELRQAIHEAMPGVLEDLRRLVRVPSIANAGYPRETVTESAQVTADILTAAGLQQVRVLDIPGGYPAVYGEIPAPEGAPTVLLYAHHDVQPAGDEAEWSSPPFELTERNGRYYGRGAADDKSGIVLHTAVLRAFEGRPPVGIKVIIEGEEEFGDSLEAYVPQHADLFRADAIVVADMGNKALGLPTLTTTLRGEASLVVEVRTLQDRVHSGVFGGAAPDALIALSRMLATLHDERGNVAIPGLEGRPWPVAEDSEEEYRMLAGVLPGVDLIGDGSLETRLWTSYSVNAVGLDAPTVRSSANVLINVARARISLRVPPTDDSRHALGLLEEHLRAVVPWHAQLSFSEHESGAGFALNAEGPVFAVAQEALRAAYGHAVGQMGSGGSIPLVSVFSRLYPQCPVILWGCTDPTARVHAPDESVDPQELESAALAEAYFLNNLARAITE